MTTRRDKTNAPLSRRVFLKQSGLMLGAVTVADKTLFGAEPSDATGNKLRAAVIGHTGKGDYGHGLDIVFNDSANVQVVAVADPNPSGRAKAAEKSKALRQYDDYHLMLEKEKPQLVAVAPRWTDQHHAMTMAALKVGAHVYSEKPFTQTLAEADDSLVFAEKAGLKIAVAHQMRLAPSILHLKREMENGLIGDLLQIRAYGKQDARAGGEDMLVLGTHLFDLIRFFAGEPLWCAARVLWKGRDITRQDARTVTEQIGPVAGDEIEARFAFANGVIASFTSRAKLRDSIGHWGIEIIGSKASVRILADVCPTIYWSKPGKWETSGKTDQWRRLENDPMLNANEAERGFIPANQRVVDDWLEAIQKNREPVCSGRAGMKAVEMVMAVYHAGLSGARVPMPLTDRSHPLKAA
ncbi:MAG: Gfo/Idh/MocA family oxidoreductase [Verrucomicrobia bacterium]|nr:Gfo/Idh/MocA family oxidoreductase [Verrucomicrobiota bacterium]